MRTLFLHSILVLVHLVFSYQIEMNHGHRVVKSAQFEASRSFALTDIQVSRKHEIGEVFKTNYCFSSHDELDFSAQAAVLFTLITPTDVKISSSHKTPHLGSLSPPVLS